MNLFELIGPTRTLPSNFKFKDYGLVFSTTVRDTLLFFQPEASKHKISPIQLTDGTWAISADVLTEASTGIFAQIFSQIPEELALQIEAVGWEVVLGLLPPPQDPLSLV